MRLTFFARKDKMSGVIDVSRIVLDADFHIVAICTDNTTVSFWNDYHFENLDDYDQEAAKFAKMAEKVFMDLAAFGIAELYVNHCSLAKQIELS